jgi:hypothetical protein
MQPVPCLRISERPVRFPSDHNTRWRLLYSQNKKKPPEINRGSPLRREGATTSMAADTGFLVNHGPSQAVNRGFKPYSGNINNGRGRFIQGAR